jgi:hypothetical protein
MDTGVCKQDTLSEPLDTMITSLTTIHDVGNQMHTSNSVRKVIVQVRPFIESTLIFLERIYE